MNDVPYSNPDREEERLATRLRLLGTDTPRCSQAGCQERDPFALTGADPDLLCAEHRADREGRRWLEESHTAGQNNLPNDTLPIPANDHAVLSHRLQAEWPRKTLRNTDGSPVLRAAAALRGWLDTLRLILERTCGWVPTFLEGLDAWLRVKLGERWWEEFNHWRDESDQ